MPKASQVKDKWDSSSISSSFRDSVVPFLDSEGRKTASRASHATYFTLKSSNAASSHIDGESYTAETMASTAEDVTPS
ncbi:hypothetical protein RRG08_023296 [Elysia crispata]|uniref:Uncharacterized protein n=1 Tax=Elysia crispata TaxID=231223 RepID=A0AAE1EFD0_9GAST|nr:hypothetical protein RRG08_023296 [Elysia crispata]